MAQFGSMFWLRRYAAPQSRISVKIGIKLRPSSVMEYSTFGGTTGYTVRVMRFCSSSSRSWWVSTRGVAERMAFCSSLKRRVPSARCQRISALYFPPIKSSVVSTGQLFCSIRTSIVSKRIVMHKFVHTCANENLWYDGITRINDCQCRKGCYV